MTRGDAFKIWCSNSRLSFVVFAISEITPLPRMRFLWMCARKVWVSGSGYRLAAISARSQPPLAKVINNYLASGEDDQLLLLCLHARNRAIIRGCTPLYLYLPSFHPNMLSCIRDTHLMYIISCKPPCVSCLLPYSNLPTAMNKEQLP